MFTKVAQNGYDCENFEARKDLAFSFIKDLIEREVIVHSELEPEYIRIKGNVNYACGADKYVFFDVVPGYVVKINRNVSDFITIVREAYLYKKTIEENINAYFARTYFVGIIDNIFISIQEYVSVDDDFNEDETWTRISATVEEDVVRAEYDSYRKEREEKGWWFQGYESYFNEWVCGLEAEQENIIYAFIEDYEKAEKVIDFMNEYCINDLHTNNFGFKNPNEMETFVMTDFSGHHGFFQDWINYIEDFVSEEYYNDIIELFDYLEEKEN